MIPINKVRDLISKHKSLENELSSGEIDKKKFAEKSKDYSDLNEIIKEIKQYYNFDEEKKDLEEQRQKAEEEREEQRLKEQEAQKLREEEEEKKEQ